MDTQSNLLRISYTSEIAGGESIYIASNSLPVKAVNKEPAGHAFHAAVLKSLGLHEEEDTDSDDRSISDEKGQSYKPSSESYTSKGKKKSSGDGKQQDHYALLGLAHLRFLATEEQIRKSYRETALKHHPDKQAALLLAEETEAGKQAKKDEIEDRFKAIQEAYEVLIDPVKRRVFDSTDEFDDEIPVECAPEDFFKVFGPAFMRNGRWSVNQPVPSLGEENTLMKDVDNFYNFWYCFKSWREFPHADEFDLEQAESRDHKRWMDRQNAKLREKARKEEHARVRGLVDNAHKRDPRIIRRKEEEKAEKQRKKEAKYFARKQQEEEAARIAEEERRRKEEEDKQAAELALNQKKLREKEKKLLQKEKKRLRKLSVPVVSNKLLNFSDTDVEAICMSLDIGRLRSLCDEAESKEVTERAQLLNRVLRGNDDSKTDKQDDKSLQSNGSLKSDKIENGFTVTTLGSLSSVYGDKKEKPWGREEIELLRKGMQKYPKGTSRRWEVISEFIGTGRSVEEILKATKTVLLQKPDSAKAFDSFLEKRKPAPSIASPLTTRTEVEGVSAAGTANGSQKDTTSSLESLQQVQEGDASQSGVSSSAEQDLWSSIQERALIQALKTFPKDTSQRWERVAAAVPGKTVIQCRKKFMSMKDNFRSKKGAD